MKRHRSLSILILMVSFALLMNGAKPLEMIAISQSAMAASMGMLAHDKQDCCATVDHELHCGCSVSSATLALTQPQLFPKFTLAPGLPYAKPVKRLERLERPPKWVG